MSYSPSIGDVVLVCRFAYSTCARFYKAPDEFQEIASDCRNIAGILKQVDQQSKDRWAPMNRSERSQRAMRNALADCYTTLQQLDEQLQKYNSLGTAAPKAAERLRYITHNFTPILERLRQRRGDIEAQLSIGTNDVVGRIYKAIRELAADMKAGRRESTIVVGNIDDGNLNEDTWTVITRELEYDHIPAQELEAHRSEIEPFVQQMRREGAFEEDPPSALAYTEISPWDSVTEIGPSVSVPSPAHQSHKSAISLDGVDTLSTFRSVPIWDISYRTIFNPSLNAKGVRIPGTFDVWELARLSWSLQRICTNGLRGISDTQKLALETLGAILTEMDPVLLLCMAESSTDKEYWNNHSTSINYERISDKWSSKIPMSFVDVGKSTLRAFRDIHSEITRFQAHPSPAKPMMLEPASKSSKFSLLRRSKSAAKLTSDSGTSSTTSFFSKSPLKFEFRKITAGFGRFANGEYCNTVEPGPEEWAKIVASEVVGLRHFFGELR